MSSPPTREQTDAVAALLTEFCWRVDNGHGSTVAALFTDDATVDTPHFNLVGREAIDAWFSGRAGQRLSRHCWSNLRVTPLGESRLRAEANLMTTVGPLPAPSAGAGIVVGTSTDEVVFADGGARFARRTLAIVFEGQIAPPERTA